VAVPLIMPKLEMSQETATVIEWLKHEGEPVEKGEPLLTIETDKVTVEVEAPAGGILAGVRVQSQQEVPVTETIAYILEPGEEIPEAPETPVPEDTGGTPDAAAEPPSSPIAKRLAAEHGIDLREVRGSGPGGRIGRADVVAHVADAADSSPVMSDPGRIRAAPAARRLSRELGVELQGISGSGPLGRIQSADILQAVTRRDAADASTPSAPGIRRRVLLVGMRRTIAERMMRSVREAPQFTVEVDVDMDRALAVVDDHRSGTAFPDKPRVTLTAFLVKACAWALVRHGAMNAAFQEDAILEWADVNIGVAVALEEGLIVPTIHRADSLELQDIAARLADLALRARAGQLRPDDVAGGTFTLSNLGMFGIDRFEAILNPPQAGILAVGRVSKRPWVVEDSIVIRPMATFSLTADHRVVDGAVASRFLSDLQRSVEHPGVML